jgi:hypothetical protein
MDETFVFEIQIRISARELQNTKVRGVFYVK